MSSMKGTARPVTWKKKAGPSVTTKFAKFPACAGCCGACSMRCHIHPPHTWLRHGHNLIPSSEGRKARLRSLTPVCLQILYFLVYSISSLVSTQNKRPHHDLCIFIYHCRLLIFTPPHTHTALWYYLYITSSKVHALQHPLPQTQLWELSYCKEVGRGKRGQQDVGWEYYLLG